MIDVIVPKVGLTIEEIEVNEWLVAEGDEVSAGDVLLVVNADKTDVEITSENDGTNQSIDAQQGDIVAVGGRLARIRPAGEAPEEPGSTDDASLGAADEPPTETSSGVEEAPSPEPLPAPTDRRVAAPESVHDQQAPAGRSATSRIAASPLARRLARDASIELGSIDGTGPGGRIVRRDVDRAVRSRPTHSGTARSATATLRAVADAAEALGVVANAASSDPRVTLRSLAGAITVGAVSADAATSRFSAVGLAESPDLDRTIELAKDSSLRAVCDALEDGPHTDGTAELVLTVADDGVEVLDIPLPASAAALIAFGPVSWSWRRRHDGLIERPSIPVTIVFDPSQLRPSSAGRLLRSIASRFSTAGDLLGQLPRN